MIKLTRARTSYDVVMGYSCLIDWRHTRFVSTSRSQQSVIHMQIFLFSDRPIWYRFPSLVSFVCEINFYNISNLIWHDETVTETLKIQRVVFVSKINCRFTCFAHLIGVTRNTGTAERVDQVVACCVVTTRGRFTFVNIWNKRSNYNM